MADKELSNEMEDKVLETIEFARTTGKIRKGSNEVTKVLERGLAKLVVIAKDVTPPEITMHIPLLSEEKDVMCVTVSSKVDLGAAAGISVGTSGVAIVEEGEAKNIISEIAKSLK